MPHDNQHDRTFGPGDKVRVTDPAHTPPEYAYDPLTGKEGEVRAHHPKDGFLLVAFPDGQEVYYSPQRLERTADSPAPLTPDEFNTRLARTAGRLLKKDMGATSVRQGYRGTGGQKHRRQLWVSFGNGKTVDLWLEADGVVVGGVVGARARVMHTRADVGAVYGRLLDVLCDIFC